MAGNVAHVASQLPEFTPGGSVAARSPESYRRSPAQLRRLRNKFVDFPAPTDHMSSHAKIPAALPDMLPGLAAEGERDEPLERLVDWFESREDGRERFRWALRDSLDELMDGQRTGRWCYQHLTKTEKTHLGTVVEVNLTREFELDNGDDLDWQIQGVDLDCKFSKSVGGWEIPMEMYLCPDHEGRAGKADHPALLVWLCDDHSLWGAGMIRITDDRLGWTTDKTTGLRRRVYNRDNKRTLNGEAMSSIRWLWGSPTHQLPVNTLRHIGDERRARIFANRTSGQARTNQLFREVQGELVRRSTLLTVAKQDDSPKRARDARIELRDEGIVVLGHQGVHPKVATLLGLEVPTKGEWIATRLAPVEATDARGRFRHSGRWWAIAHPDEPSVSAPDVADSKQRGKPFEEPLGPDETTSP